MSPATTVAWIGLALGPLAAAGAAAVVDLPAPGRAAAGVGVLMAVWWLTQAIPLSATALLPIILFPVLGVMTVSAAAAPYASDLIFLFMGGFILGLAFQRSGLHRRIALGTVLLVGTRPARLVAGFMMATAVMSMWVSNTATAMMMLPIALGVIALVRSRGADPGSQDARNFATGLLLGVAYAASIGGLGTLIGSPPNLVFASFVEKTYGVEVSFAGWMRLGVPLVALFLPLAWLYLTRWAFPVRFTELPGGRALFADEFRALGPLTRAEWGVLIVFCITVILWVFRGPIIRFGAPHVPGLAGLSDAGIALAAALALFLIPTNARKGEFIMDWTTAEQLPWGVLLLFGGGLSLSEGLRATGVDALIGQALGGASGLPTLVLIVMVAAGVIFLTELTSNTAVAATLMPVLAGAAAGLGVHPYLLLLPAALAASCGFMLPVATPPNAIVFATAQVTVPQMVRAGLWLNLIGLALISLLVHFFAGPLMGIDLSSSLTP